jgi:hypothetical protein
MLGTWKLSASRIAFQILGTGEPLLESNGFGYFTRQEHVTPFAGFTGRLYGLDAEEYESFSSPLPDYVYYYESEFVLHNNTNTLASDNLKMEVELFNSKFPSLLPCRSTSRFRKVSLSLTFGTTT